MRDPSTFSIARSLTLSPALAPDSHPVERTSAEALATHAGQQAKPGAATSPGVFVSLVKNCPSPLPANRPVDSPWMYIRVDAEGTGVLTASYPSLLYALVGLITDGCLPEDANLKAGCMLPASFAWHRPLYDTTLTQIARTTQNFDAARYIATLARCGFTHVEVNGLATHTAFEPGVPGEYYSQFYSYGPGLMQFVDTTITRGIYDTSYLQANLNRLKKLAAMGRQYGLTPGLLAYEPRTLPESFFQKYPTLRGARVDHPFRSRMPRYTMAQDHPVARAHYKELVQNLMAEVPELGYLSVWTNDSGSGFEHTASLYSGRNGGPYLIREWRNHDKIAQAAGKSAVRWLRLIKDAAAEINPEFEVSLRIEPFKVEHDTIVAGLGDGLTLEAPSLLVKGYHLPYHHPKLPENDGIAGTMFHTDMAPAETETLASFRKGGFEPIVQYAPGSTFNMEPLLGTPYPRMVYEKLNALKQTDIKRVSAIGGLLHPQQTPYWPNLEILRHFQLGNTRPFTTLISDIAEKWVGQDLKKDLVHAWELLESGLAWMPYLPLFSNFGFVWYRLWIRPFVPNIEAIPAADRRYYERFMVTMPNNSNMNDLGKDVLFQLVDETSGAYMAGAFDTQALPRIKLAVEEINKLAQAHAGHPVFTDLQTRARAALYWATTQRNLCHWVVNVYGYLNTSDPALQQNYTSNLQAMIDDDLVNTRNLLDLWKHSSATFMLTSVAGETPYIYGENFGAHLERKLALTAAHRDHAPYIDREIIWRLA